MPQLHITCSRPGGIIRGGIRHEPHAAHDVAAFTPVQLREMLAEPELSLVIGEKFTAAHVDAIEVKPAAKAKG